LAQDDDDTSNCGWIESSILEVKR